MSNTPNKVALVAGAPQATPWAPALGFTVTPGNGVIVAAAIYSINSPTISGGSGSWSLLFASGIHRCWYNPNPGAITSFTIDNNSTNSDFSADVYEVSGLKTGGLTYASAAINTQAAIPNSTPWAAQSITPIVPCWMLAVSGQQDLDTFTSTVTVPGNFGVIAQNGSQGAGLVSGYGSVAPGAVIGTGQWNNTVTAASYAIAIEETVADGTYNLPTDLYF